MGTDGATVPFFDANPPNFALCTPWFLAPVRIVLLLVLFPLRVVAFVLPVWLFCVVSWLVLLGAREPRSRLDPPLAAWRVAIVRFMAIVCSRVVLWALGFWWISVTKRPAQPGNPDRARLIVTNHMGFQETLVLLARHTPSFVAKAEVARVPLLRTAARALQVIFVERKSSASRTDTAEMIKQHVREGSGFPPLAIFPEATTTNNRWVLQMQKGAFSPGLPLQVYSISCPHSYFSPTWPEAPHTYILGTMLQLVNRCHVVDLGVYSPTEEEKQDPVLFAANVQRIVAEASGLQVSELSWRDRARFKAQRAAERAQSKGRKAQEASDGNDRGARALWHDDHHQNDNNEDDGDGDGHQNVLASEVVPPV